MLCSCCYALVVIMLMIVIYKCPFLMNINGFETHKSAVFKSDDGWFMTIKAPRGNIIRPHMLMSINEETFKLLNTEWDKQDMFVSTPIETFNKLVLPDFDTHFCTVGHKTFDGLRFESFMPGKLFGQRYLYLNARGDTQYVSFWSNGNVIKRKTFSPYLS